MAEHTPDEILTFVKAEMRRNIENSVEDYKRAVLEIRHRIDEQLHQFDAGLSITGLFTALGQHPQAAERAHAKLEQALASAYGILSQDEIAEAYKGRRF